MATNLEAFFITLGIKPDPTIAKNLNSIVKTVSDSLFSVQSLVVGAIGLVAHNYQESAKTIAASLALTRGASGDLQRLTNDVVRAVRRVAIETGVSFGDASQTASMLIREGIQPFTRDFEEGLSRLLILQKSLGVNAEQIGATVSDIASLFGVSFPDALDAFAKASALGGINLETLVSNMQVVGSRLAGLGLGFEETLATVAAFASAGDEGSRSLTGLVGALSQAAKVGGEGHEVLTRLGVQVYDAQGRMRSLVDVIQDVVRATEGLTERERREAMEKIFGAEALPRVMTFIRQALPQFNAIRDQIQRSRGAVVDMGRALERTGLESTERVVSGVKNIAAALAGSATLFFGILSALGDILASTAKWIEANQALVSSFLNFATVLALLTAGLKILTMIRTVLAAITALQKANPWLLALTVAGLVVGPALTRLIETTVEAKREAARIGEVMPAEVTPVTPAPIATAGNLFDLVARMQAERQAQVKQQPQQRVVNIETNFYGPVTPTAIPEIRREIETIPDKVERNF